MSRLTKLIELDAKLDGVLQFRRRVDEYGNEYEEDGMGAGGVAAAGVGGAGLLAGGLYARGRYVPGPVAPGFRGIEQTMAKGGGSMVGAAGGYARSAYGEAKGYATNAYAGARGYASQQAGIYNKGFTKGGGGMKGLYRGVKGVARSITKGRSRFVGLSDNSQRLMQLSSKLDEVMEFGAR